MKIYCVHATSFDFHKDFYAPLLHDEALKVHELVMPHVLDMKGVHSKDILRSCEMVLAEVSYASTGMGIELGWAEMLNVPIFAVHKADIKPSGALSFICKDVQPYLHPDEMVQLLKRFLTA